MPGPRVQLVHGLPTWFASGSGEPIAWRLLGGNQRELGRSAGGFTDEDAARADVLALQESLDIIALSVLVDARTGQWTWQVRLGNRPVAASSRGYQRRRESESNLACALSALAVAVLVPETLDIPRHRSGRRASAGSTPRVHLRGTPAS